MKKQAISFVSLITTFSIMLVMFVSVFASIPAYAAEADENGFTIVNNVLTGYSGASAEVVVPSTVVKIGPRAFYKQGIKSITIPSSVKAIADEAFLFCGSLTKVTFKDPKITTLGKSVFASCINLETIELPDTITKMGDGTFLNCTALKEVKLPANITTIPTETFNTCKKLTTVNIPTGITSIGDRAFYNCKQLKGISTLPATVATIGSSAFRYCNLITELDLSANVNMTTVSKLSFANMAGLTSIKLPESITTIADYAFYNDNLLSEITIGADVTTIGEDVFGTTSEAFTIKCYTDSAAHQYAETNSIKYELLDAVTDGWDGDSYYVDGVKLTGVQLVDGYYYNFGEDGVCENQVKYTGLYYDADELVYRYIELGVITSGWKNINDNWYYFHADTLSAKEGTYEIGYIEYEFNKDGSLVSGVWADTLFGTRYYYGPGFYQYGWHTIDGNDYYFENGYRLTDGWQLIYVDQTTRQWYYFDENGACDKTATIVDGFYTDRKGYAYSKDGKALLGLQVINGKRYYFDYNGYAMKNGTYSGVLFEDEYEGYTGIYNGLYYVNGITAPYGLYKIDGDYYLSDWGGIIKTNGTYYVGTTHCDLPVGNYEFGADGKMLNGIVEKDGTLYLYKNGITSTYGLFEIDGDYYYSFWGGVIKTNGTYYVSTTYCDLPVGNYTFDAEGKMLNGVVEKDGKLYLYTNGITATCGLFEIDGDYYYAFWGGEIKTNGTYYVTNSYCDLPAGNYTFDAEGKMLNGVVEKDGKLYLYTNGITATCGLFEVDGDYYYSFWGGEIKTNGTYYVTDSYCDLPAGNYTFGADGKMYAGVVEVDGKLYLYTNGITAANGLYKIGDDYYYSSWGGAIQTNGTYYVSVSYCDLPVGNYTFGADGKMQNGIVESDGELYLYVNGLTANAGLYEVNGDYYCTAWGGKIQTNGTYQASVSYCDLPTGSYTFDADGKMLNGFVTKDNKIYYYKNGVTPAPGLIEVDGDYYFVNWGGEIVTSKTFFVWETNGLSIKMNYKFDETGKIIG